MINDGTEVWQDDPCRGGDPTHHTRHLNPLFRLIQDHHRPRPILFRPGWGGREAGVVICFMRLRLEEVWPRGITTKTQLDRLNTEFVVEDIIRWVLWLKEIRPNNNPCDSSKFQTHPIKANGALLKYLITFWHQTRVNSPGPVVASPPRPHFFVFRDQNRVSDESQTHKVSKYPQSALYKPFVGFVNRQRMERFK